MEATTYSDFRKKLRFYLDRATDDFEPITVTRKNNRNAIVISEEEYNNMLENQFVLGNPANLAWLDKSKKQFETGHTECHTLIEPREK
ncbi:type II toxin-antitoxin system Phd/YefM family antitoxin [Levilactobacillus fujinensis]|uniref:Antitoxin n=1 Tax=Levilactobacillus fujinensis TaxID=2486024 RepID=A0ABW1TFA2_9LACO|nr:type II toxin-antitoxin system Phd/YefM family antitoxin [Levilactobacillus fujinensis]